MQSLSSKRLGQILLESNTISQQQLHLAMERQKNSPGKYLGEIFCDMGISQESINNALDRFSKRKSLGQVLLDLKILTPEKLEEVVQKQKQLRKAKEPKPLGSLLIQMGYITSEHLMKALSRHFNMPIFSVDGFIPDPSLQKLVGVNYAKRNRIIVLGENLHTIKIGLIEPTPYLIDELTRMFASRMTVEMFLIPPAYADVLSKKLLDPFAITHYR
jgi:hypothetical protein